MGGGREGEIEKHWSSVPPSRALHPSRPEPHLHVLGPSPLPPAPAPHLHVLGHLQEVAILVQADHRDALAPIVAALLELDQVSLQRQLARRDGSAGGVVDRVHTLMEGMGQRRVVG